MKKITSPSFAIVALVLTGCAPSGSISADALLENPLYAERYAEEMVDRMVEFKIQEDPILEDEEKAEVIEATRKEWLDRGRDARSKQREGYAGFLISINQPLKGEVLYLENTLYTDTTFTSAPGPNVHIYLTTVVDPRDVEFPDETAMDLGLMKTPYGAHTYGVPEVEDPQQYRTVVVWDNDLDLLYGFAQLSK